MDELTAQNPSSIQEMFSLISKKYDLTNSVLSLGIHHRWKRKLVQESQVKPQDRILDCATGTGDLAFLFESALKNSGSVDASDFCEPMLEVARAKGKKQNSKVHFQKADVMNLPYRNHEFDIASISFGIRNVQNPQKALAELARVVKPGGRIVVLEFGQPSSKLMAWLFELYSNGVLPRIGGWLSGEPQAYRYLKTSSAVFPCREAFIELARSAHPFENFKIIPLQSGIAYIYILNLKLDRF